MSLRSGYVHCACRDCMDIAIGEQSEQSRDETLTLTLCGPCEQAGCIPASDPDGLSAERPYYLECQRDDAYGAAWNPEEE